MKFRNTLFVALSAALLTSACADSVAPASSKIGTLALPDVVVGTCRFLSNPAVDPKYLYLQEDCVTSESILMPDGSEAVGNGRTITAVDPSGGYFVGAVLRNTPGATSFSVSGVIITVSGLADVCHAGDDRLRGILLDGASGSIFDNVVTGLRQGTNSGCQEGNAIEVRNLPFDNTGSDVNVLISTNTVSNYQKNGITVNGSIAAEIRDNLVIGSGPINYIAQNGIQIGFGATAILENNNVSGNNYTPKDTDACGLLFYQADGVKLVKNTNALTGNEVRICNAGRGGGQFRPTP